MSPMTIGSWIRRETSGPYASTASKWHRVDSVVADDAFTRCGRRMRNEKVKGHGLEVSDVQPLTRLIGQPQLCKAGCER